MKPTPQPMQRVTEAGRKARRDGLKRSDNPYAKSPALRSLANAWEAGFNEVVPGTRL